jgi:hypothetical protein
MHRKPRDAKKIICGSQSSALSGQPWLNTIGCPLLQSLLDAQLVPWPHGPHPAELLEAGAHDASRRGEIALDQQPHGHRGGVPAAGDEPAEDRVPRGLLVEMERLGSNSAAKALMRSARTGKGPARKI